jgi:SAM-dependent methyltransferase
MAKRPFIRKQKRKKHGATFWDNEYSNGGHLKLSDDAGEDLKKFTRWLMRQTQKEYLNPLSSVLDMGCGNGRNLIFLAAEFGMHGIGYDISSAAIKQAKTASVNFQLEYETRSIAGEIKLANDSQAVVLDMMASHFLNEKERIAMREEVFRVLKPGGWLFMKTFLRDGDLHSERLIKEFPTKEAGTYVHPVMGVPEHVYFENELEDFLEERFIIHKKYRSHKHILHGKAKKRRTISIYAQKPEF